MPISTDKAKRTVRRPKTYLDEYAEEEEKASKNADSKNAMVVQKLAPLGVPVTKHGLQHRSDWEKARDGFIKAPSKFPATMPFESWCCVTSFDVRKDDGGPQFQRLMAYLLTESTGASVSTLEADIKKEKRRPPDSYYTLTGWPKGRRVQGSYDNVYVSDTAGFTKQTYRAANVGNRSNNTVNKRSWLLNGKEPKVKLSTSVPLETYSKAAWLIASSVTPVQQPGVHSVAWGFTTDGTSLSKAAGAGEQNGKLAAGNLTAQIFGLYWYPDCNSEANNWSVNGIRMRMFNPSYVLTKNEWLLKQPLHNGGGVMGLPTPTAMNKVLENMLFVPATEVDLSHFRLENWLCPIDGSPTYATMTNGGVLETTKSHPMAGEGERLNHYVLGPHLSGGPYRPITMNGLFGDVVFSSQKNWHVDLDIGFRSPQHRDIPADVAGVPDTSQPEPMWQSVPEWRDMPNYEDTAAGTAAARRWVRTRLDKWTSIAQDKLQVRTRYLFYWGPERPQLPPFASNEQTGAPSSSSAANEEVDLDSQEEDVDLDVEPEEGNRNAFTEEVEIGQDVEYIDGVDEADAQRIGEQYQTVEIPVASTADLRDYNNDDGARSTAKPGDEYAYPGSTPHFHPSAVPYPRSAYYTEAQYTEGGPQTLGLPRKKELDALLHTRPEDFARVIGIWALQQGIKHISTRNNSSELIQLTQKQLGMTNGVYRDSKGAVVYAKPRVGTVFTELYKPAINFGSQAKLAKIREEVLELFEWDLLSGHQSRDNSDDVRKLVQFIRKHKITSSMTVAEWYNTPWHIAHLPLTAEQLHLQFHETFSMACRRCVRAFYEYDIMHATYFRTPTTFRGLPSRFFKLKAAGKYDAPVPFHEKQLWKPNANPRDTHVSNVRPVPEEDVGNPEHGLGGHHNWQIEVFDKDQVEKPPNAKNPEELRYKAHRNHLFKYASNAAIVQGRANTRSKVPLYATNFKLRRVSAYSNLCMDCAADMERLDLLARPWKKQPTGQGTTSGGVAAAMNARVRAPVRETSEERRARTEREYHAFVHSTPMPMQHPGRTMFSQPPDVYISKDLRFVNSSAKQDDGAKIREALQVLEEVLHPTSAAAKAAALKRLGASLSDGPTRMNGMIDILTDAFSKYTRVSEGDFQGVTPQYDSDVYRLEYRTKDTLRIVGFKPKVEVQSATRSVPVMEKVDPVVYAKAPASQWDGDKYWEAECARQKWDCSTRFQRRRLTQTRLFITWALHRPVTNEGEARAVLEKMRGAVEELFTDRHLSEMLRFGEKLVGTKPGERVVADSISRAQWATISAPRKADAQVYFYGGKGKEESSYLSDTYETHVEEVSVDAGCEIGPKRKHPHMHILLTVKHWSYMQLDTWHMSALFEAMFRGVGEWSDGRFKLWDASGLPFYTDQENPYINIKLYPQDNWQDIIANYVRKSSDLMSIVARTGGS